MGPRMSGTAARGRLVAAAQVALCLLLVGCGTTSSVDGTDVGAGAGANGPGGVPDAPGCPQLPAAAAFPGDASPTAALQCLGTTEQVPGDGEWSVVLQQRATAGLVSLVAALRLPSQPPTDGACPAILREPTQVQLEVAGKPMLVNTPKDPCRQTRPEVIKAYAALSWVTVKRTPMTRIRPEAAVTAGCTQWKDMLAIEAHTAKTAGPGAMFTADGPVRVCRYRSDYPQDWVDDGQHVATGNPESGKELSAASAADVVNRLSAAGPAAACSKRHSRFAVLTKGDNGPTVYVELDGCLRILAPDNTLRQGDARLVSLLTSG